MLSMSHCIPDPITVAARFDGICHYDIHYYYSYEQSL